MSMTQNVNATLHLFFMKTIWMFSDFFLILSPTSSRILFFQRECNRPLKLSHCKDVDCNDIKNYIDDNQSCWSGVCQQSSFYANRVRIIMLILEKGIILPISFVFLVFRTIPIPWFHRGFCFWIGRKKNNRRINSVCTNSSVRNHL